METDSCSSSPNRSNLSYPVNQENINVILVLVKECLITRIPQVLVICDEGKILPVRIQVMFGEKVIDNGVIFDPLDNGDSFFLLASGTDPAVNSDTHYKSADLNMSEAINPSRKDKGYQICISDWSSQQVRGLTHQDKVLIDPFQPDLEGRDPSMISRSLEQTLGLPPAPHTIPTSYFETAVGKYKKQVITHDSDLSREEGSHQPLNSSKSAAKIIVMSTPPSPIHIIAPPSHMFEDPPNPLVCREIAKAFSGEEVNSVKLYCRTNSKNFKVLTSQHCVPSHMTDHHSSKRLSVVTTKRKRFQAVDSELIQPFLVYERRRSQAMDGPIHLPDTSYGWANPPVVFKRKIVSKMYGQEKDDLQKKSAQKHGIQNDLEGDKTSAGPQEDSGLIRRKVIGNLGLLAGRM